MGILKNPALLWANLWGVDDETASSFYQAVSDGVELEGLSPLEALREALEEPEGLLYKAKVNARCYTRLTKVGLGWTSAAYWFNRMAREQGREYLRATGKNWSEQDILH